MTKKKILSIFLALLFMLSAVPVFTADDDGGISLYSRGVASASAALSVSGSTVSCTGEADAASSNYYLKMTMTLQKKNGNAWNPVLTWTKTGGTTVTISKSKSGLSSGTYRCAVVARAYDSDDTLIEASTKYSATKTI